MDLLNGRGKTAGEEGDRNSLYRNMLWHVPWVCGEACFSFRSLEVPASKSSSAGVIQPSSFPLPFLFLTNASHACQKKREKNITQSKRTVVSSRSWGTQSHKGEGKNSYRTRMPDPWRDGEKWRQTGRSHTHANSVHVWTRGGTGDAPSSTIYTLFFIFDGL